jgi:hypothetical protein
MRNLIFILLLATSVAQAHSNNILDCIANLSHQEWMGESDTVTGSTIVRELTVVDIKNGFSVWGGNATSSGADFALFRRNDGRPILAVAWASYDETIHQNLSSTHVSFYSLNENGITLPIERLLPVDENGVKFELPHFGPTIIVADQNTNRTLQKWTWKDNRFVRIR